MSADRPVFRYSRFGFKLDVYTNRIEIVDKSGLGGFITGGKKETILLRSITAVEVKGITRKLSITTADGKTKEYNVGGKSEGAKSAILSVL